MYTDVAIVGAMVGLCMRFGHDTIIAFVSGGGGAVSAWSRAAREDTLPLCSGAEMIQLESRTCKKTGFTSAKRMG